MWNNWYVQTMICFYLDWYCAVTEYLLKSTQTWLLIKCFAKSLDPTSGPIWRTISHSFFPKFSLVCLTQQCGVYMHTIMQASTSNMSIFVLPSTRRRRWNDSGVPTTLCHSYSEAGGDDLSTLPGQEAEPFECVGGWGIRRLQFNSKKCWFSASKRSIGRRFCVRICAYWKSLLQFSARKWGQHDIFY